MAAFSHKELCSLLCSKPQLLSRYSLASVPSASTAYSCYSCVPQLICSILELEDCKPRTDSCAILTPFSTKVLHSWHHTGAIFIHSASFIHSEIESCALYMSYAHLNGCIVLSNAGISLRSQLQAANYSCVPSHSWY